ncbi:MAG TPA: hypothetical protein VLC98_00045 [Phnomibacter sp.]|nr:hypothetical protein [Phnomibacter sp.]
MPLYQPINYLTELPSETISKGFGLGLDAARTGAQIQQFKAAQAVSERDLADKAAAAERQKQFQNFLSTADTEEELLAGSKLFPEFQEYFKNQIGTQSEVQSRLVSRFTNELSAAQVGAPDEATRKARTAAVAAKPEFSGLMAQWQTDPEKVAEIAPNELSTYTKLMRFSTMKGEDQQTAEDKAADRAVQVRGQDVTLSGQQSVAQTAANKLAAEQQAKRTETATASANISEPDRKRMQESLVAAQQLSGNADNLISTYTQLAQGSDIAGMPRDALVGFSKALGLDIPETAEDSAFQAAIMSNIKQYLPSSANLSNADISLALSPMPTTNATREQKQNFIKATAMGAIAKQKFEEFQNQWISQNGSSGMGSATKNMNINGFPVPKGGNLMKAWGKYKETELVDVLKNVDTRLKDINTKAAEEKAKSTPTPSAPVIGGYAQGTQSGAGAPAYGGNRGEIPTPPPGLTGEGLANWWKIQLNRNR